MPLSVIRLRQADQNSSLPIFAQRRRESPHPRSLPDCVLVMLRFPACLFMARPLIVAPFSRNSMNKLALTAALALVAIFNFTPQLSAQTASFVYTGVPTGNLQGGDTFTVGVSVLFTAGGSVTNL